MTGEASAALEATEAAILIPGADNAGVLAAVGGEAAAVGPELESVFPWGVATCPESACEVAAMAAAAIASGGVEPPEGAAAGTLVGVVLTESATATGTGVGTVACWAKIVGSTACVFPLVCWPVVLAESSFVPAVLAGWD
jgi:hypothetical protein